MDQDRRGFLKAAVLMGIAPTALALAPRETVALPGGGRAPLVRLATPQEQNVINVDRTEFVTVRNVYAVVETSTGSYQTAPENARVTMQSADELEVKFTVRFRAGHRRLGRPVVQWTSVPPGTPLRFS